MTPEDLPRIPYSGVVDADGHILEAPDLWEKYLEAKYRDRPVRIRKDDRGLEYLEVDGKPAKMSRGGTPLVRAGRPGTPAGTLYTAFAIWCDGIDDGDSGSFLV